MLAKALSHMIVHSIPLSSGFEHLTQDDLLYCSEKNSCTKK